MAEKPSNMKDTVVIIDEIETKLEKLLSKRKLEIEKDLEERIRTEKEEAGKKIEAIEKEIEKGRGILHDYRSVIHEFENERSALQHQIKEHFDRAVAFQTEIEKMAGLTLEELRQVSEINKKLETVHLSAEEKVNSFRKDLEERFGIVAQLPESVEEEELKIDLEQELDKLRKIKELLEAEPAAAMAEEPVLEAEPEAPAEAPVLTNEQGAPLIVPEINEVMENSLAQEQEPAEAGAEVESQPEQPEERAWSEEKEDFQSLFEILEKRRRIEARNGNGEIGFFQKDDKIILDGEFMVASIDESLEEAKRLYQKLSHTESPKEQFFIKQDIINHQEVLRKYILRNLKMCEKEGASLPEFTSEILNVELLKGILEKLSMENWSNPADFNSFRSTIEALKDAYYAKITPPVYYLRSLIEELGD
jgi:hypothetical protein